MYESGSDGASHEVEVGEVRDGEEDEELVNGLVNEKEIDRSNTTKVIFFENMIYKNLEIDVT